MSSDKKLSVVAIDGPVGVGKSTVARRVAETTGLRHIDTGAMYRAVALRVLQHPDRERLSEKALGLIAAESRIDLCLDGRVLIDGEDITHLIRDEAISQYVGTVADSMAVRQALVNQQRRLGMEQPSILEGRDIGTVVFPDAAIKIYLDAAPAIRVRRRLAQLEAAGRTENFDDVLQRLLERDARDRAREWGALRTATDARLIDTSNFEEDHVVRLICSMVRQNPCLLRADALSP